MDHRNAERVGYRNGIRSFRSYGQSEAQKLRSIFPLFCPEIEFSSDVDRQNFITSKPLNGHSRMSNDWKSGRVIFDFAVQLQVEFHVE